MADRYMCNCKIVNRPCKSTETPGCIPSPFQGKPGQAPNTGTPPESQYPFPDRNAQPGTRPQNPPKGGGVWDWLTKAGTAATGAASSTAAAAGFGWEDVWNWIKGNAGDLAKGAAGTAAAILAIKEAQDARKSSEEQFKQRLELATKGLGMAESDYASRAPLRTAGMGRLTQRLAAEAPQDIFSGYLRRRQKGAAPGTLG